LREHGVSDRTGPENVVTQLGMSIRSGSRMKNLSHRLDARDIEFVEFIDVAEDGVELLLIRLDLIRGKAELSKFGDAEDVFAGDFHGRDTAAEESDWDVTGCSALGYSPAFVSNELDMCKVD